MSWFLLVVRNFILALAVILALGALDLLPNENVGAGIGLALGIIVILAATVQDGRRKRHWKDSRFGRW